MMKKLDTTLMTIIILIITSVIIFVLTQIFIPGSILFMFYIVPLIIANYIVKSWDNKKGRFIIILIGIIVTVVCLILRLVIQYNINIIYN